MSRMDRPPPPPPNVRLHLQLSAEFGVPWPCTTPRHPSYISFQATILPIDMLTLAVACLSLTDSSLRRFLSLI